MKNNQLLKIQEIVGSISEGQLINVDCYVAESVGIFMPVSGPCYYAVSPAHTHPSYMFIFMFDDVTQISINGETIPAQYGKVFALEPNVEHHEVYSNNTPKYIAVMIESHFFKTQLSDYNINYENNYDNKIEYGYCEPSSSLINLLKRFMIESSSNLPGSGKLLEALSLEICHNLIRSIINISVEQETISDRLEVSRAITFIHTHIDEKITVNQIAQEVNMSASHFSRIFKREIGLSPLAYILNTRLDRVKKLLVSSNKTITQIALESGFNSSAYLAAAFMKKYNMRPSSYKRQLNSCLFKEINGIMKD